MMRIERLEGNRKIRVMLSGEDLNEMNINIKTITPDSPELHRFLFRIMEFIKKETGFSAEHGQVMVEASPQSDGVVLTVTRIEQKSEAARRNVRSVRVKRKPIMEEGFVFRFCSFDAMCEYFRLMELPTDFFARLYEYEKDYYILTSEYPHYITEFADSTDRGAEEESFLCEHGKLVAEGEKLRNMIKNIKNLN